ncbi:MAG: hypothetical protein N2441_07025 [Rhodocyclaceae bacterium]|nr:hypothetical protein [Rhodocyclaceae bacterium]
MKARNEASLAVLAEALFLTNLLVAPGLAFLWLAWLWRVKRHTADAVGRCHLEQTFFVSLWGGLLLVATVFFLVSFGADWGGSWVVAILYFTCIHSTLVLFGILGLARAMAGKPYRYPGIGPKTPACD